MAKSGFPARFFGHQLYIHYRSFTKLGVVMVKVIPHNPTDLFKKRTIDGGEIGYFQIRRANSDGPFCVRPKTLACGVGKLLF